MCDNYLNQINITESVQWISFKHAFKAGNTNVARKEKNSWFCSGAYGKGWH